MDSRSFSSAGAIAQPAEAPGEGRCLSVSRRRALSEREKAALKFIRDFVLVNAYAPSYSQIARSLSIKSKTTAEKIVCRLRRRKLVERSGPIVRGRRFEGELRVTACGFHSLQTLPQQ